MVVCVSYIASLVFYVGTICVGSTTFTSFVLLHIQYTPHRYHKSFKD